MPFALALRLRRDVSTCSLPLHGTHAAHLCDCPDSPNQLYRQVRQLIAQVRIAFAHPSAEAAPAAVWNACPGIRRQQGRRAHILRAPAGRGFFDVLPSFDSGNAQSVDMRFEASLRAASWGSVSFVARTAAATPDEP